MCSNKDSDPVITTIINQIDSYLKEVVSRQLDLAVVSDQLRGNIKYLKKLIIERNFIEGDGLLEGHGSLIKAYNLAGSFENDKKWQLFNEYFATASSNLVKYNNTLLTKPKGIRMQPDKTVYLSSSDLIDFIQKNFNLKTTDTTIKSGGKTLVLTIERENLWN